MARDGKTAELQLGLHVVVVVARMLRGHLRRLARAGRSRDADPLMVFLTAQAGEIGEDAFSSSGRFSRVGLKSQLQTERTQRNGQMVAFGISPL